jgi:NAD(P)-dependent dehydrogenase (short-subunit alcohol dehydrogenase family)
MSTIIMTGGTFGLGEATAQRLSSIPGTRLILGGRETRWPLELASLSSVRQFARQVLDTLGETKIDALVLNAGLSFPMAVRTADGYETTFAVNHLGHYLLLRLLAPALAPDAIVVITTSNTHDPMFSPVAPFPYVDAHQLAYLDLESGSQAFESGFRAYATSKLCNLLTARAFAAASDARVIAYNPGYIPGTGLGRNLPPGTLPVSSPHQAEAARLHAGHVLADLAVGRTVPPPGRLYASLVRGEVTWPEPSELARREDVAQKLWNDSAVLTGLA